MQPDTTSAGERCQGSFPACASQCGVREKLKERRQNRDTPAEEDHSRSKKERSNGWAECREKNRRRADGGFLTFLFMDFGGYVANQARTSVGSYPKPSA
jgi:hypothetical protein